MQILDFCTHFCNLLQTNSTSHTCPPLHIFSKGNNFLRYGLVCGIFQTNQSIVTSEKVVTLLANKHQQSNPHLHGTDCECMCANVQNLAHLHFYSHFCKQTPAATPACTLNTFCSNANVQNFIYPQFDTSAHVWEQKS